MNSLRIPNRDLCIILITNDKSESNLQLLSTYISKTFNLDHDKFQQVEAKISHYFLPTFEKKWKESFYRKDIFEIKNKKWLDSQVSIDFTEIRSGRKSIENYSECSKSTKKRRVQSIQEKYSAIEIQDDFLTNLRISGKIKLANAISQLLLVDFEEMSESSQTKEVIPFTDDETLALIEDAKLSKHQYQLIRSQLNVRNAKLLPHYKDLSDAKKRCYPPNVEITESRVTLVLQDTLNHALQRLIQISEVREKIVQENASVMKLILKYGCDGASGFSAHKQVLPQDTKSDESIFSVSMVPLILESESSVIWKNPHPASVKFCIPLTFCFEKESSERTRFEINRIEEEINNLLPTILHIDTLQCKVNHVMTLTMVDGKVCQALTETPSAATCYVCKANPSEMNNLEKVNQKVVNSENFQFGLSTFHAWMCFMNCILHIAYRLEFCQWRIPLNKKDTAKEAKTRIQNEFRRRTGILIDIPQSGAGNSNSGNTARRFFRDPQLTSEIAGVNVELIKRFGIILQVMSSSRKINTMQFKIYTEQTAKLYVELYSWFYMPSSVHKILVHGAEIIERAILPIGQLSEEAQEARNKDYKRFREYNTRKCNRLATNQDLIHKLLISSDMLLGHLRHQ